METTCVQQWMNGEIVCVCVCDEILFSHKNEAILPFVITCMDFEGNMLREITQRKKYYMISLICGI